MRLNWPEVLKFVAKWGAGIGVSIAAMMFIAGEWRDWRRGPGAPPAPVVAAPTERVAEAPTVRTATELAIPQLPQKVVRRIERSYGRTVATVNASGQAVSSSGAIIPGGLDAAGSVVLTEVTLPRLPEGGGALVTRTPGGAVEVTVLPTKRRFLELRSEWALGALVDPTGGGDWRGYARYSGLRLGRVHALAEAGAESRAGRKGGYALVGAEVRFGR